MLYARVSSKEQEKEGFSIPAQKLLENYAHDHGFREATRFVDVETAKRASRPGFAEMVALLHARESEMPRPNRGEDRPPLSELQRLRDP